MNPKIILNIDDIISSQLDESSGQCAVCGKSVSQSDGSIRREHGDETVALCCTSCVAAFEKDANGCVRRQKTKKEVYEIYQLLRSAPSPSSHGL